MKYKFKTYSENIVFFDTEFSGNDADTAELLSIGLIKLSGEELYLEIETNALISPWVKKHVIPQLKNKKVSARTAVRKIKEFIGSERPYIISFVVPFDFVYLYKLFDVVSPDKLPFHWPPLDFASILFGNGINPGEYYQTHKDNFFKKIGVHAERFQTHNALDDAKLLRSVYMKMSI